MEDSCTWTLVILLILYVILGAAVAVMNRFIYIDNTRELSFSRDGFVNLLMFFSEISGIPLYYILLYLAKKKAKIQLTLDEKDQTSDAGYFEDDEIKLSKIKKLWLQGSPALLDLLASFFGSFATILLPTTTYIMLRGMCLIFITFLISKYVMVFNHLWDHYIAIFIAIAGFILVIISLFVGENSKYEYDTEYIVFINIIGIEFIIVSTIFQSTQFVLEQKFMRKYLFHPFLFIGIEGVVGFVVNIILCIIFYNIKCSPAKTNIWADICLKDENGVLRLENILLTLKKVFSDNIRIILVVFSILCIGGYNIIGICINKYGGAMTRSVIDNFKSFLVWIFFWFIWNKGELKEKYDWFVLTALILLLISIIIYFGPFRIDEKIEIRKKIKDITLRENFVGDIKLSSVNKISGSEQIEF